MEAVHEYVKTNTQTFDASHDYAHAVAVHRNLLLIVDGNKHKKMVWDLELLEIVALLHDVCDHKYKCNSIELLRLFLNKTLGETRGAMAMTLIENISYSKQLKHSVQLEWPLDFYLDILRDADRLESLGKVGIERCTEYVRSKGGKIPEDVILHCHEKLIKLYPEHFIKTEFARSLAEPLHNEIIEWVNSYIRTP